MMMTMKKTFYYNFIPSKAEEEECKAKNIPFEVTRVLVEIRDIHSAPKIDPQNPWQIKKSLTQQEVMTGKLVVPFNDTFQYIFRYWPMSVANHVAVLGQKMPVVVWDVTDDNNAKRYHNDRTFFERLPNDDYILSCPDLVCDRRLCAQDEIGLYWDTKSETFQFKILLRNSSSSRPI